MSVVLNMESYLILYTTEDGVTKVEVTFVDDTVWLTQEQMADWAEHLDRILVSTGEHLLEGKGTISHLQVMDRAESDYKFW